MADVNYFLNYDENEQNKELYAQFGLCIYWFQVLEHQLINMILLSAKEKNLLLSNSDYDALFYSYSDKAMGALEKKILELYNLTEKDKNELKSIRKKRNYFVHNYFKNHSEDFFKVKKKIQMLKDFIDTIEEIKNIDKKLEDLCDISLQEIGITQDTIDSLLQEIKNGDNDSEDKLKFGKKIKT